MPKNGPISHSAITFEYSSEIEHVELVRLLRAAILTQNTRALVRLGEVVKDLKGAGR